MKMDIPASGADHYAELSFGSKAAQILAGEQSGQLIWGLEP
ncbi:hypothetical protein [Paenibacillus agricola]